MLLARSFTNWNELLSLFALWTHPISYLTVSCPTDIWTCVSLGLIPHALISLYEMFVMFNININWYNSIYTENRETGITLTTSLITSYHFLALSFLAEKRPWRHPSFSEVWYECTMASKTARIIKKHLLAAKMFSEHFHNMKKTNIREKHLFFSG